MQNKNGTSKNTAWIQSLHSTKCPELSWAHLKSKFCSVNKFNKELALKSTDHICNLCKLLNLLFLQHCNYCIIASFFSIKGHFFAKVNILCQSSLLNVIVLLLHSLTPKNLDDSHPAPGKKWSYFMNSRGGKTDGSPVDCDIQFWLLCSVKLICLYSMCKSPT